MEVANGPDYNSAPLDFNIFRIQGNSQVLQIQSKIKNRNANEQAGFIGKVNVISGLRIKRLLWPN